MREIERAITLVYIYIYTSEDTPLIMVTSTSWYQPCAGFPFFRKPLEMKENVFQWIGNRNIKFNISQMGDSGDSNQGRHT